MTFWVWVFFSSGKICPQLFSAVCFAISLFNNKICLTTWLLAITGRLTHPCFTGTCFSFFFLHREDQNIKQFHKKRQFTRECISKCSGVFLRPSDLITWVLVFGISFQLILFYLSSWPCHSPDYRIRGVFFWGGGPGGRLVGVEHTRPSGEQPLIWPLGAVIMLNWRILQHQRSGRWNKALRSLFSSLSLPVLHERVTQ